MLDLTQHRPLKVGFKYKVKGATKVFEHEGEVSYSTIGVYDKHLKKSKNNKAVFTKDQDVILDIGKQLEGQAIAEHAMMEEYFGDRYEDFNEALEECGVDKGVIIQYVVEQILEHIDALRSGDQSDEGEDPK